MSIFVNSIFALVLSRMIIQNLGSDYNGVNATITQILAVLTLVEGGFTTASTVSLFKPFIENDYSTINNILTTTSKIFKRIAIITLLIGTIISFGYSFFIKSSLDQLTLFIVFFLSILSTSFNLFYVNNYKIVFQVAQNEFIINSITTFMNILTQITAIFVIILTKNIIFVRLCYFIFSIVLGFVIVIKAKSMYKFISLKGDFQPDLIKGTKDVVVGRFTSIVYSSASVLFLSTFVGTVSTSIYATYNSVINIVKNCVYSVVNAPQNALGQLFASEDKNRLKEVFNEYEYIVVLLTFLLLTITYIMIVPFVGLYTKGISDTNYIDPVLATLMILISTLEIIHIPSGIMINMSGNFRTSRNIQIITCVILVAINFVGAILYSIYGLLIGTIISNIILASLEMFYVRKKLLKIEFTQYFKCYLPLFFVAIIICLIGSLLLWNKVFSLFTFLLFGLLISILTTFIFFVTSYSINKTQTIQIIVRLKKFFSSNLFKRFKNS